MMFGMIEGLPPGVWVPIAHGKYGAALDDGEKLNRYSGISWKPTPHAPIDVRIASRMYDDGVVELAQRRIGPNLHEQLVCRRFERAHRWR